MALRLTTTPLATEQGARRPTDPGAWVHGAGRTRGRVPGGRPRRPTRICCARPPSTRPQTAAIRRRWRCSSRASAPPDQAASGLAARIFGAVAGAALDVLERRPASRSCSTTPASPSTSCGPRRRQAAVHGGPAARSRAAPLERNLAEVRAPPRAAGRAARADAPGRCRRSPAARRTRRPARRAGDRLTLSLCMIVRDEERDAAALPGGGRPGRRRDRDRRHRLAATRRSRSPGRSARG